MKQPIEPAYEDDGSFLLQEYHRIRGVSRKYAAINDRSLLQMNSLEEKREYFTTLESSGEKKGIEKSMILQNECFRIVLERGNNALSEGNITVRLWAK